jgi:alpha-D-ribose 1-methylphosphonate 5-triphosphate synthase subunit PhnG
MEAAALYAFARARGVAVLCLAHVTNTMGQSGQDFEKGEADGTAAALRLRHPRQGGAAIDSAAQSTLQPTCAA